MFSTQTTRNIGTKKVTVLGAGMSGWLTALYLKKYLGSILDVQLVAPKAIHPMTVGESTNGPFTGFLNELGISTKDIIQHCDGTIKIASEFHGWNKPGAGYDWVHEFQSTTPVNSVEPFHTWLSLFTDNEITSSYQDSNFINKALLDNYRIPYKSLNDNSEFNIGYHLDSQLLAVKVREEAEKNGVKYIDDKLKSTVLKNGLVHHIILESGLELTSDLFIDCTGFAKSLMKSAYPDNKFVSLKDRFPNHSAIYTNIPTDSLRIRPSTKGTALSAGWVWDIPLQSRTSIGYVYSKQHINSGQAADELLKTYDANLSELKHIDWDPGYMEKAWVGNVISIGVSNSFIEPIESLTSAMLTFELNTLLLNFPSKIMPASCIRSYNEKIKNQCINNIDFISLHYYTATRNDTSFWIDRNLDNYLSTRVIDFINEYKEQAPMVIDGIYDSKAIYGMFTARDVLPDNENYLAHIFSDKTKAKHLIESTETLKNNISNYMLHADFIEKNIHA